MEQLKKTKINDMFVTDGVIRPDGLLEKEMYIVQVKTPAESKGDWDFYKILKTMKGDEAYGKLAEFRLPPGQEIARAGSAARLHVRRVRLEGSRRPDQAEARIGASVLTRDRRLGRWSSATR